ncbi:unnamed protein product, partial [Brenthis ino]
MDSRVRHCQAHYEEGKRTRRYNNHECFLSFSTHVHTGSVKKQLTVPLISVRNQDDEKQHKTRNTDGDFLTTTEVSKNCMCSKIYDPVCGTDDKSYYNLCQLECENKSSKVIVKHQGKCIPF